MIPFEIDMRQGPRMLFISKFHPHRMVRMQRMW